MPWLRGSGLLDHDAEAPVDAAEPGRDEPLFELPEGSGVPEEEVKHTPGPWKWWTSCSWRRLMGDVYEKERHVLQPTNHPIDHHPDIIVTDADMRLIEAAPELLEACTEAQYFWYEAKEGMSQMAYRENAERVRDLLLAAIAKAEGKK